jgi:integrase
MSAARPDRCPPCRRRHRWPSLCPNDETTLARCDHAPNVSVGLRAHALGLADPPRIDIPSAPGREVGEGQGPTKSGRTRKVPMTKMLEAALKKQKHLRGSLVFCGMDGSPYTIDQLHAHLQAVIKRAGLRRVRWQDLRHSFGSQAAIAGVPLPQIQARTWRRARAII